MTPEIARRLVLAAYEKGWRDACEDFLRQGRDDTYAIGEGKLRSVDDVTSALDPMGLLGLSGGAR